MVHLSLLRQILECVLYILCIGHLEVLLILSFCRDEVLSKLRSQRPSAVKVATIILVVRTSSRSRFIRDPGLLIKIHSFKLIAKVLYIWF